MNVTMWYNDFKILYTLKVMRGSHLQLKYSGWLNPYAFSEPCLIKESCEIKLKCV